jgi:hypothetical protein
MNDFRVAFGVRFGAARGCYKSIYGVDTVRIR